MSGRRRASSDGNPTGTRGGTGGTGFGGGEFGSQGVRRLAQQQAQRVDRLCFLLLQDRNLRQRGAQLGGGVGHVQIGGHPASGALLRQVEALLGGADVLAGNAKLRLRAAKLDVIACDLGQAGQQDRAFRLFGRLGGRGGRFDRTPDAAPQIDLPRRIETALVEIERLQAGALYPTRRVAGRSVRTVRARRAGNEAEHAVVAGQLSRVGRVPVQRGEQRCPSDTELRARFGQADGGGLDVEVFRRHALFQPGQNRDL